MLSVFIIAGQEVLTLVASHSCKHWQELGDTSVLAIWWKPILPMNKFVTMLLYLSAKYSTLWRAA